MIKELKILHQKRQEQNSKSLHAKKQSAWSKIEAAQEMVALAKNFRFVRLSHVSDTILMQFSDKLRLNQTWEGPLKEKYPTIWTLKTWTENFLTALRGCGLQGNPIVIKGNPHNLRSYLYPTDAIKQILRQTLISEPQYSQIGSFNPRTILSVAQTVAEEFGVNVEILNSQISRKDNYVPQDVPTMLETDFSQGISLWAKWLKSGFKGHING